MSLEKNTSPLANLPQPCALAVMDLPSWALVRAQGPDSLNYLQGQVTLDLNALTADQHQLAGHCDAKGKMWSNLRLFMEDQGYSYIVRRSVREQQMAELKKYAIFSKLDITADDSRRLIGVVGQQAVEFLSQFFSALPNEQTPHTETEGGALLWLPTPEPRFMLIVSAEIAEKILAAAGEQRVPEAHWLALEIAAGLPVIEQETSGQFIPQATNLQALDAISFKKGCYSGQEMVARAKYHGANKRALYWLAGQGTQCPAVNSSLELKMDDKWRRTGTILAAVCFENGEL